MTVVFAASATNLGSRSISSDILSSCLATDAFLRGRRVRFGFSSFAISTDSAAALSTGVSATLSSVLTVGVSESTAAFLARLRRRAGFLAGFSSSDAAVSGSAVTISGLEVSESVKISEFVEDSSLATCSSLRPRRRRPPRLPRRRRLGALFSSLSSSFETAWAAST